MVYFNKGNEGYKPIAPDSEHIFSSFGCKVDSIAVDGLYNLVRYEKELPKSLTVSAYQEWVENSWKAKHGTYEAAQRFVGKLLEEVGEMKDAYDIFIAEGDRSEDVASELLSEIGDVLWCTTACASNSTADLDAGIKLRMYEHAMGIAKFDKQDSKPFEWRKKIAEMATLQSDLKLSDINEAIELGYEPFDSILMNISDDGPEYSIDDHIMMIMTNAVMLRGCVDQQYCYGELGDTVIYTEQYDSHGENVRLFSSNVLLHAYYVAHHVLGASIEDVLKKNILKIDARVSAKKVDKTDGVRSQELL